MTSKHHTTEKTKDVNGNRPLSASTNSMTRPRPELKHGDPFSFSFFFSQAGRWHPLASIILSCKHKFQTEGGSVLT